MRKRANMLEIYDYMGSNKDLEKASKKVWPKVTYKGQDIVDFIMDTIKDVERGFGKEYSWMQECYGGYDIKTDTYYIGFDMTIIDDYSYNDGGYWDDMEEDDYHEENGWVIFFVERGKPAELFDEGTGMFYSGGRSGFSVAKKNGWAHLRLD